MTTTATLDDNDRALIEAQYATTIQSLDDEYRMPGQHPMAREGFLLAVWDFMWSDPTRSDWFDEALRAAGWHQ